MLDVSKETNIRFLREAVKVLQADLLAERKKVAELTAAKALDEELCNRLSDQLLALKQKFFVGGRERMGGSQAGRRQKKGDLLPHNRSPLSDVPQPDQMVEADEIIHSSDESNKCSCGCDMAIMTGGFETSSEFTLPSGNTFFAATRGRSISARTATESQQRRVRIN